MSAASHLRIPVAGTAVPAERGYQVPAAPARRRSGAQKKTAVKPMPVRWLGPVFTIALCAGIALAVGLGLVAQKARLMSLQYELAGLQSQLAELEKQRNQLQLALVSAASPEKVELAARQRLNMTRPEHVEYLVLAGGETVKDEPQVAARQAASVPGPLAALGQWFTGNWPRIGTAEASPKQ